MNKRIVVSQDGPKDCAVACALSIIRFYNGDISKDELSYILKTGINGTTAYDFIEGMKNIGFTGYGIKYSLEELIDSKIMLPVVAHTINQNYYHYVVIYEINRKYVKVMDPSSTYGIKKITINDFKNIYLGTVLVLYPSKELPKLSDKVSLLNNIFKYLITKKRIIKNIIFLSILIIVLNIVSNSFYKIAIDYLLPLNNIKNIIFVSILFGLIILLVNIFNFIRNKITINLKEYLSYNLMNETVSHLFNLPYRYFKNKSTGEIVSRLNEYESVKDLTINLLVNVLINGILILFSMIILLIINRNLFLISLVSLFIYFFVIILVQKNYKKNTYNVQQCSSDYNNLLIENIDNYESINNLGLIKENIQRIKYLYIKYLRNIKKLEKNINVLNVFKNLICDLTIFIIVILGLVFVIKDIISLGDLVLFYTLLTFFYEPFKSILDIYPELIYTITSYERINELLLAKEDDSLSEDKIDGDIKIQNLSFSYNNIDDIFNIKNLLIKKNSKILLCGKSGCGKSTLANILLKHFDNYKGDIYINNINLKDIESKTINNSIVYVSQKENLFTDTLENNIKLYRDVSNSEYEIVCKICNVDKIRDKKQLRNNFFIEYNGFNLSGGERQKIILARGLLKHSNYIILDEALSEVEFEEEKEIITKIFKYYHNKTIIYISHKNEMKEFFHDKYIFS